MRRVLLKTEDGAWIEPYTDFGMLTVTIIDTPPAPKVQYVDLPGRDGVLDMSEWAGVVRFGSRNLQIKLRDLDGGKDRFVNAVYGNTMRIYTDEDTDYYYTGRCDKMTAEYRQHGIWDITMDITCDAYRRRVLDTMVSATAPATVTLKAERRPAIPTITASGACTITIGGVDHECAAGTFQLPDLLLTTTAQNVIIAGSGVTVDFTWTDGRL